MKKTRWKTFFTLCITVGFVVMGSTRTQAQRISASAYIEQYKDIAISYMNAHGCPASIILAIAMHESAYGNSRIARYLNNHFGIKGPNNSTEIRSAYKGYTSVEESYRDFIDFLKRRKPTQVLFDQYEPHEYQQWVRGIARAGYAQSPTWSAKVIGMIKKYNLHEFDLGGDTGTVEGEFAQGLAPEQEVYIVRKGDTLSAIAKRYGTTVKAIQRNNGLSSSRLQIGQQLFL